MSNYFYHCTANTLDILIANQMTAASSMGFFNISFFRETTTAPILEKIKYYRRPDNVNGIRFGESVYPIGAAFCFEAGLKNDVGAAYTTRADYDATSGLIKKGAAEYLFPGSLALNNPHFWGLRIPRDEEDAKGCVMRKTRKVLTIACLPCFT